jgi:hypothetical protein
MKKIVVFIVSIMLLLLSIPTISSENTIDHPTDEIVITIKSGLFPYFEICNEGTTPIFNATIEITIDGPLVLMGGATNVIINEIPPGECASYDLGFIFGFGPVTITIEIRYDDTTLSETFHGFLIGFLFFIA